MVKKVLFEELLWVVGGGGSALFSLNEGSAFELRYFLQDSSLTLDFWKQIYQTKKKS